jgi:hypothetical protein
MPRLVRERCMLLFRFPYPFRSRTDQRASTPPCFGFVRAPSCVLRAQRSLAVGLALIAAACSNGNGKGGNGYLGDASFGTTAPDIDQDAASEGLEEGDLDAGESSGVLVKLRVFHGVLNLPGARFCHDLDYTPDDPSTAENELDPGPELPRPILAELDAGTLPLGVAAGYFMADEQLTGAILVYRAALAVAGGLDAGGSSNVLLDAGREAGATSLDAAVDPCDPASLEAILPIPLTTAWLEPPRPVGEAGVDPSEAADAGASVASSADAGPSAAERRGFVATLSGRTPLTLFGSGRSLDPKEVAARRLQAREDHLKRHAGDNEGAEAAGRATQAWIESNFGPRFLLSRGPLPATSNTFALSFVHLVPDVLPTVDAGTPMDPLTATSGPLHLCVRADTTETDLAGRAGNLEFRNATALGRFDAKAAYVFRLFVEADFTRTQANCGVTGLKPVAELTVRPQEKFFAGGSYTLVAWGARSPDDLCTVYQSGSVVRPGCARPANELNARIEIFENEPPEPE